MNKEHIFNCVILSCLKRPGVIWRFFRRFYFHRLNQQIERLPKLAARLGREYRLSGRTFIVF
jgi:hypothetical protein